MASDDSRRPLSERGRSFLAAVEANCLPLIQKVTVPILGIQDDTVKHDRTAVLYRIGGEHFALTAAHDLQGIVKASIPLFLSLNIKGVDNLLPLAVARFISTEENDRDVAAIWLPPDVAQEIGKHRGFLQHNQIDVNVQERSEPYLFFGYPMGWSGLSISQSELISVALAFPTWEYSGERDPLARFDLRVHMVVQYNKRAVNLKTGKEDELPSIKGISGCGIWQVGNRSSDGLRPRCADNVTLVGIEHTNYPAFGYLQATRVGYLLDVIGQQFPSVAKAMTLAYPSAPGF